MENNPDRLEFLTNIPMLVASTLADEIINETESVVDCYVKWKEIDRERISENHFVVHNGSKFTVIFNSAHINYLEDKKFVKGVIYGCKIFASITRE